MSARQSFAVAAGSRGSSGDAAPYRLYKLLIHDRALDPVGGVGTGQDAGKRQRKRDGGTEGLAGDDAAPSMVRGSPV